MRLTVSNIDLFQLAENLRNEKVDLLEYIHVLCDRVEKIDQHIHSLLPEPNRRKRLVEEATQLQRRFPDLSNRPPLYGIPVGIKDIFLTEKLPTRAGSKLPVELFAGKEASAVTKLKEAGALILGKTVTTEFAHFEPGPTVNPHNHNYTPGGSSSGSAAIVSAGLIPLALGTQTSGSVLRPAAFCGVYGFKPSYDRIPKDGLIYCAKSVDHIGLFTQDIKSMKVASSVLCKEWKIEEVRNKKISSIKLGIPEGKYLAQMSDEGLRKFTLQLKVLEENGFSLTFIPMFENLEEIVHLHETLIAKEMADYHAQWFEQYESLYGPRTIKTIRHGQTVSEEELIKARNARMQVRKQIETIMDDYEIDLFISPAALGPAPKGLRDIGNPAMNIPWTNAGLPSITIPVGKADNHLPLGLQLVAKFMEDEKLLTMAEQINEVFNN